MDLPVLGPLASLSKHRDAADPAILVIGDTTVRENLMHQLGAGDWVFATVVHPLAIVVASTLLGAGSAVIADFIVGTEARLGVGSILNCGAVVDHYAVVEDYGHLGLNASMAGGKGTFARYFRITNLDFRYCNNQIEQRLPFMRKSATRLVQSWT